MSRPFSYNDENFTVIGSLLIMHIPFNGSLENNQVICKVPPEIAKRIQYTGIIADYYTNKSSPSMSIKMYVSRNNLYISNAGVYDNGQFFAITNLKDI